MGIIFVPRNANGVGIFSLPVTLPMSAIEVQALRAKLALLECDHDSVRAVAEKAAMHTQWLQASVLPRFSRYTEYGTTDLAADDALYMFAERFVLKSLASHRISSGSSEFAPAPQLAVIGVAKVVNARLLRKYLGALEDLEGLRREPGCQPIPHFGRQKVHPASCGATDLNEHFAFHGAQESVIEHICRGGFDPQRGGEGAGRLFGVATYFAANASKSDIYTDDLAANIRRPRA